MERTECLRRINDVLREVFNDPALDVTEATTAAEVPGWDSLKHIYVLVAIEQAFGISFDLAETVDTENIGGLVDIILRDSA